MPEPAALDLAAIRENFRRSFVTRQASLRDVVALIDELECCRAERDALREGLECWLEWRAFPQDIDIEALLKITRAALGEVTQ